MAREHIKAFADVPNTRVVGIHSRTRSKAEALASEFGLSDVTDGVEQLYARAKADLVVVAVPELSMRAVALAAFAQPWAVLLEKPAGYNLADAAAIAAAARGKKVFVALNRRFNSSTRTVAKALNASPSSQRFINIFDQQSVTDALAIGHPREVAENFMYANSVHVIDLARVFGRGEIVDVVPVVRWNLEKPGVVVAKIAFSSGDAALYQGIWNGPGPWAAVVTTDRERWELRPLEEASLQKRGERVVTRMEADPVDKSFKAGFRRQAEAVCDGVRGRKSDAATIDDALESMKLIARIFGNA
jgi:predicted dehydrogenase